MRLFLLALIVSAAAIAGSGGAPAERNPVRTHTPADALLSRAEAHQIIVKFRANVTAASSGRMQAESVSDRISSAVSRAGLRMRSSRPITEDLHVLVLEASEASAEAAAARFRSDPQVEYAVPDQRRYIHAVPTDPLFPYPTQTSAGQWYLQNDPTTPSAVNAQAAWDITKGSASLVIADLDTGVLFNHPDLKPLASGGRLLPGYDFISDAHTANDGDGRDADASDPGDQVTSADATSTCKEGPSSWHGTRTAGILGALTNNAVGVAGMTWNGRILPVRVLGICGGYDSDIIAGMMWAAGIPVTGVPANPTPAKILNMSLGGTGSCPASYADAIAQVTAKGALVVVSAGNEGGAVDAPADCPGVAGIAAIRQEGDKVGFSNLGPQLTVGAPGGNCVNTGTTEPCLYPVTSTTNLSVSTPDPNAYDYTGAYSCDSTTGSYAGCTIGANQYRTPNLGTSFSAPIVSGIAALMVAANPNLNSCQIISRLREGSRPFPQTVSNSTITACKVPASTGTPAPTECLCTNDGKTCGAGMANALGAVNAALRPIAAVKLPASVSAGASISLSAAPSTAAAGHSITTYQWTSVGSQSATITSATSATASVKAPSCGFETVQITVTDDGGRTDVGHVVLSPTAASSDVPLDATDLACVATPKVMVAVCPATASLQTNGSQNFTASVANTSNSAVTWEVNGVAGGSASLGTITSGGVYTAPASVPSGGTVTVEAVSAADTSVQSTTTVTITAPPSHGGGGGALDLSTLVLQALLVLAGILAPRWLRRSS